MIIADKIFPHLSSLRTYNMYTHTYFKAISKTRCVPGESKCENPTTILLHNTEKEINILTFSQKIQYIGMYI